MAMYQSTQDVSLVGRPLRSAIMNGLRFDLIYTTENGCCGATEGGARGGQHKEGNMGEFDFV